MARGSTCWAETSSQRRAWLALSGSLGIVISQLNVNEKSSRGKQCQPSQGAPEWKGTMACLQSAWCSYTGVMWLLSTVPDFCFSRLALSLLSHRGLCLSRSAYMPLGSSVLGVQKDGRQRMDHGCSRRGPLSPLHCIEEDVAGLGGSY